MRILVIIAIVWMSPTQAAAAINLVDVSSAHEFVEALSSGNLPNAGAKSSSSTSSMEQRERQAEFQRVSEELQKRSDFSVFAAGTDVCTIRSVPSLTLLCWRMVVEDGKTGLVFYGHKGTFLPKSRKMEEFRKEVVRFFSRPEHAVRAPLWNLMVPMADAASDTKGAKDDSLATLHQQVMLESVLWRDSETQKQAQSLDPMAHAFRWPEAGTKGFQTVDCKDIRYESPDDRLKFSVIFQQDQNAVLLKTRDNSMYKLKLKSLMEAAGPAQCREKSLGKIETIGIQSCKERGGRPKEVLPSRVDCVESTCRSVKYWVSEQPIEIHQCVDRQCLKTKVVTDRSAFARKLSSEAIVKKLDQQSAVLDETRLEIKNAQDEVRKFESIDSKAKSKLSGKELAENQEQLERASAKFDHLITASGRAESELFATVAAQLRNIGAEAYRGQFLTKCCGDVDCRRELYTQSRFNLKGESPIGSGQKERAD